MRLHFALLACALVVATRPAQANQVSIPAQLDTTLYAESGAESNGLGIAFFAGTNGQNQVRRGLIRFNVASVVPAGSTVNSVQLTLYMSKTNGSSVDVRLHRVTAAWGEGTSNAASGEGGGAPATAGDATWTQRVFPSTPWTTPGGDFVSTPSATLTIDGIGSYTWGSTPGLVADVQAFVDGSAPNHGWILINADELSAPTAKRFWSRNSTSGPFPALLVDFTPPGQGVSFCAGDGTQTACPCANSGAAGAGCANSVDANGGRLVASGVASVAADTFALSGSGMPNGPALYFQGSATSGGGLGSAFGDGLRCATGTIVRLKVAANVAGASSTPSGTDLPIGLVGGVTAGQVANYQVWYRDSAAFCAPETFNLTNAVAVTWIP